MGLRTRRTACAGVVTSVLLAGCGTTTLDQGKLERFVTAKIAGATGVTPKDVSCPSGRKPKAGEVIACRVSGHDATRLTAQIREVDDKGNGRLIPLRLVNTRQVQRGVANLLLRNRSVKARVRCPELTLYVKGHTLDCTATATDGSRTARVLFTDDVGGFSVDILAAP